MELSGMFYIAIGNKEAAKISLMGEQACYVRWGAQELIPALEEHLKTLKVNNDVAQHNASGFGLKTPMLKILYCEAG